MSAVVRVLPALVWAVVMFWGMTRPMVEDLPSFPGADKLVHVLAHGGLAAWLVYAMPWRNRRAWVWAVTSALYGVGLELYQGTLPHRTAELGDIVADVIGAAIAIAVWGMLCKRRQQGAPT